MPLDSLLAEPSPAAYTVSGSARALSVGEETEQVCAGQHTDRLAVLDDEGGVGVLELLARCRHGRARTHQRQALLHVLLDRVGEVGAAGEERLQQRALAHGPGDLTG